jgi:hypothetical protein
MIFLKNRNRQYAVIAKTSTLLLLGLLISSLVSCSSYFKRKDCEAKNWYQHAYDLALRGLRVSNDSSFQECKKVEAEFSEAQVDLGFKAGMAQYCTSEQAFLTGKKGQVFNLEFCDSNTLKMLVGRHREGVNAYCTKENAFSVGAAGESYTKICNQTQEMVFIPEFRRGRKKFLESSIQDRQMRMSTLTDTMIQKRQLRQNLDIQLLNLPKPQKVLTQVSTAQGLVTEEKISDPWSAQRQQLSNESQETSNELSKLGTEHTQLTDELSKLRIELGALN